MVTILSKLLTRGGGLEYIIKRAILSYIVNSFADKSGMPPKTAD